MEEQKQRTYDRYVRRMVKARKQPLSFEAWRQLTALEAALPPTKKSGTYA